MHQVRGTIRDDLARCQCPWREKGRERLGWRCSCTGRGKPERLQPRLRLAENGSRGGRQAPTCRSPSRRVHTRAWNAACRDPVRRRIYKARCHAPREKRTYKGRFAAHRASCAGARELHRMRVPRIDAAHPMQGAAATPGTRVSLPNSSKKRAALRPMRPWTARSHELKPRFSPTPAPASALDRACCDIRDELLADEQEQKDKRNDRKQGSGDDHGIIRHVNPVQRRQRHLKRIFALVGQDDQRPQVVVPRSDEGEGAEEGKRGPQYRQGDVPIEAQEAAAVDAAGIQQLGRHRFLGVLPDPENPERIGHSRNDQRLERADPAEFGHNDEGRHERQLGRRHHGRQQQDEQHFFAREIELGEREARKRIEEQHQQGAGGGDEQRIPERSEEIDVVEHPADVVEKLGAEPQLRREAVNIRCRARRHDEQPVEREDRYQQPDGEADMEQDRFGSRRHHFTPCPRVGPPWTNSPFTIEKIAIRTNIPQPTAAP
ncbi:hypothetical protein BN871_IC_00050 [Paenibacillus sp. P22]|nr:hypothetical protein BN871_IC_00050 [Paenibacillus sp. P22]